MPAAAPSSTFRRALFLIPFAVLLTIHPLLIHGISCGQDLAFHIQSWLDAAQQLRHGTLYPHWDTTAAWNAGEPRFLFYPPLSWLLGAILTLIFPINLCPTIFIAIALLASGLTFYKLASHFASPNAALIASTLYLANPYMLFTAFERSALAELLAAAWIPLLLLAALRIRPTLRGIAIPLALLWLTNAPAAVIGSYALALIAILRMLTAIIAPSKLSSRPEAAGRSGETCSSLVARTSPSPFHLALTYLAGTILGLTLPAIYLLPAAYERRFIQVSMAIIPNLRYQDNFLFTHTSDAAHNAVNHTISALALTLLLLTATAILALLLKKSLFHKNLDILSERDYPASIPFPFPTNTTHTVALFSIKSRRPSPLAFPLTLLTFLIAVLLTPLSTPIWQYLPELAYLQFPWRLLALLTPILALAIALLLDTSSNRGAPACPERSRMGLASETWVRRMPSGVATTLTLLLPLTLTAIAYHLFHQPLDPTADPTHLAQLFTTQHGFPPTDEYTPTLADNDPLRTANPAYWLAHSPNDPAPNTLPTAADLNPNLDTDDTPIPDTQTISTPSPHHFTLTLTQPSLLVLNLRDYPDWQVTNTDENSLHIDHPRHISRNDGLIAIAVAAGQSTIDITWRRTLDEQLGLTLSALSLIAVALTFRHRP
jgi:hypothetical protein